MKRLFSIHKNLITLLTIAVLALTPGFAGDAYAQDRDSQMIDDADITEAINVKLAIDERIDADNIEVSTQDYIVILEGYVADIRSKELAVSISQSIRGVKSVVNNIDVMAIRKADLELKRDVSEALAMDDVADKYQIEVEANDGVVTLNGMVESFAEKQITENVAKNVSGVKEINNNLQVDYDAKRADYEIRQEVERRLRNNNLIYSRLINVRVEDNVVMLNGIVGSQKHKNIAYDDAWVGGVKEIDTSGLEVRWYVYNDMVRTTRYPTMSDRETEEAIRSAMLYDPRVASFRVDIDVEDGMATLMGRVPTMKAKRAAESDAMNTLGVWKVVNNIEVHAATLPDDDEIEERLAMVMDRHPVVSKYDIKTTVNNHKAYLDGEVTTRYEKALAEDIATSVFGVIAVQNNIDTKSDKPILSDKELKEQVRHQLTWDFEVDGVPINIEANDGKVILTGDIDSKREYKAAIENAFQAGALAVEAKLLLYGSNETMEGTYYYKDFYNWTR